MFAVIAASRITTTQFVRIIPDTHPVGATRNSDPGRILFVSSLILTPLGLREILLPAEFSGMTGCMDLCGARTRITRYIPVPRPLGSDVIHRCAASLPVMLVEPTGSHQTAKSATKKPPKRWSLCGALGRITRYIPVPRPLGSDVIRRCAASLPAMLVEPTGSHQTTKSATKKPPKRWSLCGALGRIRTCDLSLRTTIAFATSTSEYGVCSLDFTFTLVQSLRIILKAKP